MTRRSVDLSESPYTRSVGNFDFGYAFTPSTLYGTVNPSLRTMLSVSPGRSSPSRKKTARPSFTESTCPTITVLPISPGLGPNLYHPAKLARSGVGTWMVLSLFSPSCMSRVFTPMRGMVRLIGIEAGSPVRVGFGVAMGVAAAEGVCVAPGSVPGAGGLAADREVDVGEAVGAELAVGVGDGVERNAGAALPAGIGGRSAGMLNAATSMAAPASPRRVTRPKPATRRSFPRRPPAPLVTGSGLRPIGPPPANHEDTAERGPRQRRGTAGREVGVGAGQAAVTTVDRPVRGSSGRSGTTWILP